MMKVGIRNIVVTAIIRLNMVVAVAVFLVVIDRQHIVVEPTKTLARLIVAGF